MKLKDTDQRTIAHWDRWFIRHKKEFSFAANHLKQMRAGKPIVYVEIGCWAGASAEWTAQNVLTHIESIGIGIDPYPPDKRHHDLEAIQERARTRLEFMGNRWRWIKKPSVEGLLELNGAWEMSGSIDLLYIDGQHHANDVLVDFALAWPLLKPGSVVIFDDYKRTRDNHFPNVDTAVAGIKESWGPLLEPIGRWHWQAAFVVKHKSANKLPR